MKTLTVVVLLLLVVVAQMAWAQDGAKGPIVLPPDVELSALTGTAFPEGILGGAISYRFLKFAASEQYVWADLGLQVDTMDAGKTSPIVGGSTNLPTGVVKSRAGAGVRAVNWNFGRVEFIFYTRIAW